MRSSFTAALCAAFLLVAAAPAVAHPRSALDLSDAPGSAYTATDNVELIDRMPEHTGTAGGRVLGDRFYLTDPRGVYVYDVSEPESPELLGSLTLPQSGVGVALAQEDPDTDGRILLVDAVDPSSGSASTRLQVVDVSDPSAMQVIGSAPVTDHTWTCVSTRRNDCAFAYGRTGYIVDLRDPTAPVVLEKSWREHVGLNEGFDNDPYAHDLTEIRTGRVMSAGAHNVLMDTSNPARPRAITDLVVEYHQFGYHSIEWANDGRDTIMVAGTEIAPEGPTKYAGSDCQGEGSWINTYDTRDVLDADRARGQRGRRAPGKQPRFRLLDSYHVQGRGIFLDGNAPAHTLYCAHWMELAPDFDNGGRMVVAYYDWGTRFVDIAPDGTMSEIGWYVPADGYTGSAQWVSDDIVYVMDYRRGLEVLRLADEPATGVVTGGADAAGAGASGFLSDVVPHVHWGPGSVSLALALAAAAVVAARRGRPRWAGATVR